MKNLLIIALLGWWLPLFAQDADEGSFPELIPAITVADHVNTLLRYPDQARLTGVDGVVKLKYSIDPSGRVTNVLAEYLGTSENVPEHDEDIVIVASAPEEIATEEQQTGLFALQAESLLLMQRIRSLRPSERNGRPVLSSRETRLRFVLE